MNRRRYLGGVGAAITTLGGGTALAKRERLDIVVDSALVRAEGEAVTTSATVEGESVTYLESTDEVRYLTLVHDDGTAEHETESFESWANRECAEVAAEAILPAVESRLDEPPKVGRGIRGLLFGLVVTVDHGISYGRDGSVMSKPNVDFDELVSVAPRSITTTITLEEREHTRSVPVAVEHTESQLL